MKNKKKITLEEWRNKYKNSKNARFYKLEIYERFMSQYGFDRTMKHIELLKKILAR